MVERRVKPRIQVSYPAVVRGYHSAGVKFETRGQTDSLSAAGLYLRVPQTVEPGTELLVVLQLSTSTPPLSQTPPRIAARGIVVRTEPGPDGTCGLGIKFKRYFFI